MVFPRNGLVAVSFGIFRALSPVAAARVTDVAGRVIKLGGGRRARGVSSLIARMIRLKSVDYQEQRMSGTSSSASASPESAPAIAEPQILAPDELELAALLCSKVCHDLISPVGAIVNGLEVLDDSPKAEDREFALELIRKSAKTASARLQFCRLAFGAAGSAGAQIDLGDAQTMARGQIEDAKTSITWNLPRLLLPKNRVKLLLNMMVIAQQTIPRGGMITVDSVGDGETMSFRVAATGLNARVPQSIVGLLSSTHSGPIDAHAVQPHYTRLLAEACGLKVSLVAEGDAMVVSAA
jgi:histidine phosphotransferase ChpT